MPQLTLAIIAFVGSHFLLSHPLRAPIVARASERGFLLVYTLVAFATLGWAAHAFSTAPVQSLLWPVGDAIWAAATIVMLLASILFVGSLVGNPALPGPPMPARVPDPRGVFAITRHPMMWSFALWAAVHVAVYPAAAQIVLAAGIATLALIGAALQDAKKRALQPDFWPGWAARTAFLPFAAIVGGRLPWRAVALRPHALAGGVVFWLAATWAHIPLVGWAAGIWRWIGA